MKPQDSETQTKVIRAKKKHVMKDIEEWATQNLTVDLNHGNTRMSGKNDDTVTEFRMLKTRLLDLGVERYKFLTHYSHEKQKMMDLKKKKQQTMKNIRSYTSMSEPGRWRPSTSSSRPSTMERASEFESTSGSRYGQPEQVLDPSRYPTHRNNNFRQNDDPRRNQPLTRGKTVQFIPTGLIRDDRDNRTVVSEPQMMSTPRYRGQSQTMVIKDNVSVVSFRPRSGMTDDDSRSWTSRRSRVSSKYGGRIPSVTGDTRYAMLERALSSNYEKRTKTLPVHEIVRNIESLHKPPKNVKENKPKWELKIQAFKKEAGITW